jgi:fucose 4-O-acetylase-like acetyltransferase
MATVVMQPAASTEARATTAADAKGSRAGGGGGAGGAQIQWVNVAKGIGIILMVICHVGRGLKSNNLATPHAYDLADTAIYTFHMSLFFFLSGLFVVRGMQKSAWSFFGSKVRTILYPYFLWATLLCLFTAAGSGYANSKVEPAKVILHLPWDPYAQFWFLYVLMLCMTLYWVLYKLRLGTIGIAALAAAAYFFGGGVHLSSYGRALDWLSNWQVLYETRKHGIDFALGALLAPVILQRRERRMPTAALGAIGIGLLVLEAWLANHWGLSGPDHLTIIPRALGIAGVCFIAAAVARWEPMSGVLAWLGELTLPIFLAHVIVAGIVRVGLVRFAHVSAFGANLLLGSLAGLAVPVFMDVISKRIGFNYLFAWGEGKSKKPR